jgi:acetyl-CoA acyltransferase
MGEGRRDRTRARGEVRLIDQSIEERQAMADNGNGKFGGREVVIVEAVRTPIGRGHEEKGYYKDVHPSNLLAKTYNELFERSGVDPAETGDVIAGCAQQFGEQGVNIGRNAWLEAGLPIETPATTIDRQCGSAQQAVNFAATLIASGVHDVAIGGGVEHMGHISFADGYSVMKEHGAPFSPELMERYNLIPQGLSAEMIADQWEIPRSELDELGVRSQQLAAKATEEGRFEREIVPFSVNGDTYASDQGIRPETSIEVLSQLKPAFKEDGKITAGNSSQVSDGAAAVLLMAREKADALGLKPRARIFDQTTVGVDPVIMLTGPIPATRKLLERNGMKMDDIDLVEINEAFASVVAAWRRELEPDMDRVNVNGGAIALGHPLGSTGARLITTLLHEMERTDKEMGLVTMCCGGGLGTGTLIQRI